MLNAAIYIVFAVLLIVCALLLLVVLMQRPKQEGLGAAFGAQMTDQAFGAQTTDVLKKGTVLFGTLFMVLCFVLTLLMNHRFQEQKSQLGTQSVPAATTEAQKADEPKQEEVQKEQTPAPAAETPAAPVQDNLENLVTPAPAAEQPAEQPATETPAPAVEQPAAETPAPAAQQPAAETPAPAES